MSVIDVYIVFFVHCPFCLFFIKRFIVLFLINYNLLCSCVLSILSCCLTYIYIHDVVDCLHCLAAHKHTIYYVLYCCLYCSVVCYPVCCLWRSCILIGSRCILGVVLLFLFFIFVMPLLSFYRYVFCACRCVCCVRY